MGFIYSVIWFQSNGPVFLYSPLSVTGSPLYDLLGLMLSITHLPLVQNWMRHNGAI